VLFVRAIYGPIQLGYGRRCLVCEVLLPYDGRALCIYNLGSKFLYSYEFLQMYLQLFRNSSAPFDTFRTTMCATWSNSEYVSAHLICLHTRFYSDGLHVHARSAASQRLAQAWTTAQFQRDFMRYIATMRLRYDRAMQYRKCAEDGGPQFVTMDGTATSI
jgi:hypothetical protein